MHLTEETVFLFKSRFTNLHLTAWLHFDNLTALICTDGIEKHGHNDVRRGHLDR